MTDLNSIPLVDSTLDLQESHFVENATAWEPILAAFQEASKAVSAEAQPSSQLKHQSRGQLLGEHVALTQRSPSYSSRAVLTWKLSPRQDRLSPRSRLPVPRTVLVRRLSPTWRTTMRKPDCGRREYMVSSKRFVLNSKI